MKAILTFSIVLGILMTAANMQVAAQGNFVIIDAEQEAKNIEKCTNNLIAIGKSIQIYMKEHGDYPEWLSNLYHPKYLPDPDVLICPSDKSGGKAIMPRNVDPKMPVSYGYQFHGEYRAAKTEKRIVFGDVIPLVRCRHHAGPIFHCLNLSFSYKITKSFSFWELLPEQLYETSEEAVAALEAGLQQQSGNERLSCYVYPALARLYIKTGRKSDVDGLINEFKSVMDPDYNRDVSALADMLEMMNRNEELLELFKELETQHPADRGIFGKLAEIFEKLGNAEQAMEYRKKAEPALTLIGNPMPDFSAIDLDGNPISLQDYRGKVVLLDFWAVWCAPCIAEMPNLKNVYDTYKDEGFEIIGISLDTDETKLRNYLKENEIPWRQVFSGKGWGSPVAEQFGIRSIPAPWLIARDGTLISIRARGNVLEELVAEAVKDKSSN